MTGKDFYEEFKAALDYLGVGFRGMDEAQVQLDGSKLRISVDGRECAISIPVVTPDAGVER